MFNKLTCKVQYEAWVNAIRASSFIENVPQINAKPIAFQRNLLRKLPRNRAFFLPIIFQRNWPRKSREIGHFFREFDPENPVKFDFFSATYQKPCQMHGGGGGEGSSLNFQRGKAAKALLQIADPVCKSSGTNWSWKQENSLPGRC